MTSIPPPMCYACAHADPTVTTCTAYPSGIPTPILLNEADHRTPLPGDNGIVFAQNPAKPAYDFTIFDEGTS